MLDTTTRTYRRRDLKGSVCKLAVGAVMMASMAGAAGAKDLFETDSGWSGKLDVELSLATLYRLQNPALANIDPFSNPGRYNWNFDDGNRNFGKGFATLNFSGVYDLEIRKDSDNSSFGIFHRGAAYYDAKICDSSGDNVDGLLFNNSSIAHGGSAGTTGFSDWDRKRACNYEALDAFVFADFGKFSDHPVSLRVGRQVVNWGESAFLLSGIMTAINPVDASKAVVPGTELKQILRPVNQAYGSVQVTPNLSIEGYYQFEHRATILPPSGFMLSVADIPSRGSENVLVPVAGALAGLDPMNPGPAAAFADALIGASGRPFLTIDNAGVVPADDDGQFGIALRYYSEALNSTEFGLYFANYHSKTPNIALTRQGGMVESSWGAPCAGFPPFPPTGPGTPGPTLQQLCGMAAGAVAYNDGSGYRHSYMSDSKLIAGSFSTMLTSIDTSVSGEIAYHWDVPIQTMRSNRPAPGFFALVGVPPQVFSEGNYVNLSTRHEVLVGQMTFNKSMQVDWADNISILSEFGFVKGYGVTEELSGPGGIMGLFRGPDNGVPVQLGDGSYATGGSSADKFAWGYRLKAAATWYNALAGISDTLSGTDMTLKLDFNHDVSGTSVMPIEYTDKAKALGIGVDFDWQQTISVGFGYVNFMDSRLYDRDYMSMVIKYRF